MDLIRQDNRQQDSREAAIQAVINDLTSEHSKRAYEKHLTDFLAWHTQKGKPGLSKAVVNEYKTYLQEQGKSASVINQALSAIRKLVREAADNGAIDPALAQGIANVKGIKSENLPAGRALSQGELSAMIKTCKDDTKSGARDAAVIAMLYSCGLRRAELINLDLADYNSETGELRILHAKRNKQRTIYIVNGAKRALDDWLDIRGNEEGPLFLQIRKGQHIWQERLSTQAIYHILQTRAQQAGVTNVSPHDFRRTFIGDLLDAGADIATVQKLAGHSDISTTARYDRRGEEAKKKAVSLLHVPY